MGGELWSLLTNWAGTAGRSVFWQMFCSFRLDIYVGRICVLTGTRSIWARASERSVPWHVPVQNRHAHQEGLCPNRYPFKIGKHTGRVCVLKGTRLKSACTSGRSKEPTCAGHRWATRSCRKLCKKAGTRPLPSANGIWATATGTSPRWGVASTTSTVFTVELRATSITAVMYYFVSLLVC